MCMMADEDFWATYDSRDRKARKAHTCGECGRTIHPGEVYNVAGGRSTYGGWHEHKTCAHCDAASAWLTCVCDGWVYRGRQEDLGEHVIGHEAEVRSAALVRLYRWMLADWRDRHGHLRPVEDVRALTDRAIAAYRRQYDRAVAA